MILHRFMRYMTAEHTARIVAHVFDAPGVYGDTISAGVHGDAYIVSRDEPGDVWDPPRKLTAAPIPLYVWIERVEQDGFVYGDADEPTIIAMNDCPACRQGLSWDGQTRHTAGCPDSPVQS